MSGLIDVLGTVLANSGKTTTAASNGDGIDIMSIIQMFNQSRGGSSMNMNVNGGSIDIGSILGQLAGGSKSGSSDLISMILKQVLGGAMSGMGANSSIQTGSTTSSSSAGPLGNMSMTDIATMAQGAAVILNKILKK